MIRLLGPLRGRRRSVTAFAIGLAWMSPALAAPPDGETNGNPHAGTVTARLVSKHVEIRAGEPFVLGVEITMAPGWHTYWENGGDAGLPTSIEWDLPAGFEAGEILWPAPHRYEETDDLVTFGYAEKTLLLTEIAAPADASGTVDLAARVDWLQCKDICIPGGADLAIRLPVGPASKLAPDAVVAAFERTEKATPRSAAEHAAVRVFQDVDAIPAGGKGNVAAVLSGLGDIDAGEAEFFPRMSDQLWFRDATFRSDGANLALSVPVEVDGTVEPHELPLLSGVVRVPRPDGEPWILSLELPVTIAASSHVPAPTRHAAFSSRGPLLPDEDGGSDLSAAFSFAKLLRYLGFAFVGGLILNVMPCVLPVVSLKVLGFVSKADEDPAKVTRLGWTFGAGVLFSFLVLAALVISLQVAGEHIGWGFQFQNPAFVAALAAVVFVFSLSLLGVFEVGGTTSLIGLGLAAVERKDYADAFFHGVLTTVLATPCTAPMLGTAIAFAFVQPPWVILLIFTTVAAGLAAPYVLLSMHPGWLKYVPRPGLWMERFKQGMGFLLLATLVWLLYVFGAQTGADGLSWLLAFLLVLGFFCWLHGAFVNLASSRARVLTVWMLTLVGCTFAYAKTMHPVLFAPDEAHLARPDLQPAFTERVEITRGGIVWEPFTTESLEDSIDRGKTVFLDFTADWCLTCKVNEKTVLADAEVEGLFRDHDVVTLKGDWTRKDPEITEIIKRHNRPGVPFYAIYPAGRPSEVIVLPEIINKKIVLESLRRAGPSEPDA